MENRSDEKEPTLRQNSEQPPQAKKRIYNQHDWPPPILLSDGSFMMEAKEAFTEVQSANGQRWIYERRTGKTKIDHIRVIHGSGVMLYQDLYPDEKSSIELSLDDGPATNGSATTTVGNIIVKTVEESSNVFVFLVDSDRRLDRPSGQGGNRLHRYAHPGPGREFRIRSIQVKDSGGNTKFMAKAQLELTTKNPSEEYRVLVWLD